MPRPFVQVLLPNVLAIIVPPSATGVMGDAPFRARSPDLA